jgi:diacylglycerol kinase (ATP)
MNKPNGSGLSRIIKASQASSAGFKAAFVNEAAFRQELFLVIILAPLAVWLGNTGLEKAMMLASLLLVLIVELLNSGLEAVVDRIGLEHHLLSGRAKDLGSAAVFLSLMNVVVVWFFVLCCSN